MTEQAAEARKEYQRAWRARNRDKVKLYNERYWTKRAEEAKDNAGSDNDG